MARGEGLPDALLDRDQVQGRLAFIQDEGKLQGHGAHGFSPTQTPQQVPRPARQEDCWEVGIQSGLSPSKSRP